MHIVESVCTGPLCFYPTSHALPFLLWPRAAERFFQLLKRERIRRRVYATRDDARADVFNYIEMFYNLQSRHSSAAGLSPVEFEQRHSKRLNGV